METMQSILEKDKEKFLQMLSSEDNAQGSPLIASVKVADATARLEAAAAKAPARKRTRSKASAKKE